MLPGIVNPLLSPLDSLSASTTRIDGSDAKYGVAQGLTCPMCVSFCSLPASPSPGGLGAEVSAIDRLRIDNDDELSIEEAVVSTDGLRREDEELFEKSVEESDVIDSWTDRVSVSSGTVE